VDTLDIIKASAIVANVILIILIVVTMRIINSQSRLH
jgi:hypothetical protein